MGLAVRIVGEDMDLYASWPTLRFPTLGTSAAVILPLLRRPLQRSAQPGAGKVDGK
jgi:hypothetical protein